MEAETLFLSVEQVILTRRTCKKFNGPSVSKSEIEKLLHLAVMAPNHRLNQPWKFRVLTRSGIQRLVQNLQQQLSPEYMKTFSKFFDRAVGAGALVFVSCERNANEAIDLENYAATCAAIQNILLGATALKMQSYWSTGQIMTRPETLKFINLDLANERYVGTLWLGWGEVPAEAPRRIPAREKTTWIE